MAEKVRSNMDEIMDQGNVFSWGRYLGPRLGTFVRRTWAVVVMVDYVVWWVLRRIFRFVLRVAFECVCRPIWTLFRVGIVLALVAHFVPSVNVYGRHGAVHKIIKHASTRKSGGQPLVQVPVSNEHQI